MVSPGLGPASNSPPDCCIKSVRITPLFRSKKGHPVGVALFGASDVIRTRDLLITSEMHYRLCYTSKLARLLYMEPG